MASRKKERKLPVRPPILPYARAMKAYAYANKPFRYAMEQLGYLYLEVPRFEVESHAFYWEQMKRLHNDYRKEARKLSRDFVFSHAQIEVVGLDPFYWWIVEDEDPSAFYESGFTQDIIDEMRHFRLRQTVSVLLRLGESPEAIHEELLRQGFTNWMVEHILFYNRFFWYVSGMRYEDWLAYLYIANPYPLQRTDENGVAWRANPHFTYLKEMVTMDSAESLRFKCGLPLNTSISDMDKDLQLSLGQMVKGTMRVGDFKNTAKLMASYTRMAGIHSRNIASDDDELTQELKETMAELQIIGSPAIAKRLGVNIGDLGHIEPVSRSSLEGEFSDPRKMGKPTLFKEEVS